MFGKLVIRESSDHVNTSSDAQLSSDWHSEDMRFLNKITLSKEATDKRMISLFELQSNKTRRQIEAVPK